MNELVLFGVGFALLAASTHVLSERAGRPAWRREHPRWRFEATDRSPCRDEIRAHTVRPPDRSPRAPWGIRAVALWSIVMGQMFVPGLLLALYGLVAGGLGVVGLPGLWLAAKIWRVGPRLLRADPDAAWQAREASRFATALNQVVIVVCAGFVVANRGGHPILVFTLGYAAVSLAHAKALEWAALALEHSVEREPTA